MKRIVTWVLATVGGVVLLFSYRTSTQAVAPGVPAAAPAVPSSSAPSSSAPSSRAPSSASPSSGPTAGSGLADGTYTGGSMDTRYGPVQVRITVKGGRISDATAVEFPQESRRDQEINGYAIPQLQSETVSAQNDHIDMVSGATYTSEGYLGSLQDALDQAHA